MQKPDESGTTERDAATGQPAEAGDDVTNLPTPSLLTSTSRVVRDLVGALDELTSFGWKNEASRLRGMRALKAYIEAKPCEENKHRWSEWLLRDTYERRVCDGCGSSQTRPRPAVGNSAGGGS